MSGQFRMGGEKHVRDVSGGTLSTAKRPMIKRCLLFATLVLCTAGCVSPTQLLDNKQAMAVQTAVSRAQFEMNCQSATGDIISREVVQPALQGPWVNGIQRAEYTVGVTGCGKRHIFIVICPETGEGCFAAGPGRFIGDQ